MMRRTILLVATMALSLFAANCVLLASELVLLLTDRVQLGVPIFPKETEG